LRLVAQRDRPLTEEFLEKLKESQEEPKRENSSANSSADSSTDLWGLPDALQQRLNLAESLLREGNVERALQFADPILVNVTISTIDFLTLLREKDPAGADQRYAAMLAATGNNMAADANTVSLLSSYLFTPRTYVIFNRQGAASSSAMPATAPVNASPQLRLAFFQTASNVLLRPQPPPEQDHTQCDRPGEPFYQASTQVCPGAGVSGDSTNMSPCAAAFIGPASPLSASTPSSIAQAPPNAVPRMIT